MAGAFERYSERMPLWVAFGAVLGIAVGLFFGELTRPLGLVSTLYAALMQIAAIPYLISSVLHGLASISREHFGRLIAKGIWVYALLLSATFAVLFVLVRALSFDSTPALVDMSASDAGPSLVDRIIPVNIVTDLTENYLPALIVFSILYGIAIQDSERKASFLEVLVVIKSASVAIWRWVVFLAPLAVFSVMAEVSGTMPFVDMVSLSSYLLGVLFGVLIIGGVIIPLMLGALYPGVMRIVWPDLRNGLIIAVTTSLSVAALPFIRQAVMRFLEEVKRTGKDTEVMVESTLSLSYPLAQLGNFFIWIFIAFAATYYRESLSFVEQALLPVMVLLSAIGSPSTSIDAVSFLTGWLQMPDEAVSLYSGMFPITRYAQVIASVMGFLFMTVAVAILYEGIGQFRVRRLALCAVPAVVAVAVSAVVVGALGRAATGPSFADYGLMQLEPQETAHAVSARVETAPATAPPSASPAGSTAPSSQAGAAPAHGDEHRELGGVLGAIQRRGRIRVGYNDGIIPFSYRNNDGALVGFDIEYIDRLARDLNVEVDYVPFTWDNFDRVMDSQTIDIAVAGIYVTNERLQNYLVSEPYYTSPLAMIVQSSHYEDYLSRSDILSRDGEQVTVFRDPVMEQIARNALPGLPVNVVDSYLT
ncbi:MAG: cation:dicarboxylase symporter family transporter, partial [Pseudomonadota bacterium]